MTQGEDHGATTTRRFAERFESAFDTLKTQKRYLFAGKILTIETVPLKLPRRYWDGPEVDPDQTFFPDEYLRHILYITRIYFISGEPEEELIGEPLPTVSRRWQFPTRVCARSSSVSCMFTTVHTSENITRCICSQHRVTSCARLDFVHCTRITNNRVTRMAASHKAKRQTTRTIEIGSGGDF